MFREVLSDARIKSINGEAVISESRALKGTGFSEIRLEDGEIDSVITAGGVKLKRGMAVTVSSRYTGTNRVAVICGFIFNGKNFPVMVSKGGAEGELAACVRPDEITLFRNQQESGELAVLAIQEN